MAYGYNDGDQRRQSVRLAGRTTPTPGSVPSGGPQRSQEQLGASSRQHAGGPRQGDRPDTGTRRRQADVSQLRRNDRRQSAAHINHFFSRPQSRLATKIPRPASRGGTSSLPIRRARIALCSIVACLIFLLLGSCISHGSAGLDPTAEDKLLKPRLRPATRLRFRPRVRSGKPAPCPISIRLTRHGRSCPTPAVPSAKMPAALPALPWSTSIRPATPI